jgi:adenosylcobinamide-phosphate synthase
MDRGDAIVMAAALALAWAWDCVLGEPRSALHPVAWLGKLLGPIGQGLSRLPPTPAFLGAALVWSGLAVALARSAYAGQCALAALAPPWRIIILAALLKPCFAWRMLRDEVRAVDKSLAGNLAAGRERVACLVSRDVSKMDAQQIRETAIETLAENLNDSVVALLFWFAIAGLPGAVVYRFANTADAMWGYRGRFEWAGKWAARADDVLSWVPARLTAALLCSAPSGCAWRILRAQATLTPSPNGGWPMSAMALRLGVRLRKPGVYALNANAPSPSPADLARALRCAGAVAWLSALAAMLVYLVRAA